MFRFIQGISKRLESDRTLRQIVELNKNGQNTAALRECTRLVEEYPFDVQIRHRLAIIQKELGEEICLPDISPDMSK